MQPVVHGRVIVSVPTTQTWEVSKLIPGKSRGHTGAIHPRGTAISSSPRSDSRRLASAISLSCVSGVAQAHGKVSSHSSPVASAQGEVAVTQQCGGGSVRRSWKSGSCSMIALHVGGDCADCIVKSAMRCSRNDHTRGSADVPSATGVLKSMTCLLSVVLVIHRRL